jgi:hypothetical protein
MLRQLDRREESGEYPVAWRNLDYGPVLALEQDPGNPAAEWNVEQAQRRSLRNLEQRGLVRLGQYSFAPEVVAETLSPHLEWTYHDPDRHVPGESRYMTGVELTDEGRRVARQRRRQRGPPSVWCSCGPMAARTI